jgi:hypothetical protein
MYIPLQRTGIFLVKINTDEKASSKIGLCGKNMTERRRQLAPAFVSMLGIFLGLGGISD